MMAVHVLVYITIDIVDCCMDELTGMNFYLIEASSAAMNEDLIIRNVKPLKSQTGACVACTESFKTLLSKVKVEGKLDKHFGRASSSFGHPELSN